MNIQINGNRKSRDTRKAERFFSDRGIAFHRRDVVEKPLSPREIETITHAIDPENLIDSEGARFKKRGLAHMVYDPLEEIVEDPLLLRLPIVRNGAQATVGYDPETWIGWIDRERS